MPSLTSFKNFILLTHFMHFIYVEFLSTFFYSFCSLEFTYLTLYNHLLKFLPVLMK